MPDKVRLVVQLATDQKSEFHLAVLVILGYLSIVLVCIIVNAPLIDNPNRAGMSANIASAIINPDKLNKVSLPWRNSQSYSFSRRRTRLFLFC